MKTFAAILAYLAFVFGGGALLAPWVHYALLELPHGYGASGVPFHLVVVRSLFAMALVGLYAFIRSLGTKAAEIGLAHPVRNLPWFGFGFLLALAIVGLQVGAALAMGAKRWAPPTSLNFHLSLVLNTLPMAVLVAFLVELLFRGGVFGAVEKAASFGFALALSSALYAVLHFFGEPSNPPVIGWHSGWEMLETMVGGFAGRDDLLPALPNLFLSGLLLALCFARTGSLYCPIGLNAGLVLFSRWLSALAPANPRADSMVWGGGRLVDGWAATAVMVVALFLVFKFLRPAGDGPRASSPREVAHGAKKPKPPKPD